MQRCSKCDAPNPDNLENCYYCDTKLETPPEPQSAPPTAPHVPIKAVPRDKVHILLNECASNFIILGYVITIATMVCGIIWALCLLQRAGGIASLIVAIETVVISGIFWTIFRAASGLIKLAIRIEENTRPVAEDSETPVL